MSCFAKLTELFTRVLARNIVWASGTEKRRGLPAHSHDICTVYVAGCDTVANRLRETLSAYLCERRACTW